MNLYRGKKLRDQLPFACNTANNCEYGDIQPACVCRYRDEIGIGFVLSANFANYQPDDVLIFWSNGEITTISDDVEIVHGDLWQILEAMFRTDTVELVKPQEDE